MMKSPLRILHLEDNPQDAELIQAILETEGFSCEVTRVDTEADFLASVEGGGFDLILTDYTLPSFDGLSALKIAREKSPDVPFLFVSGSLGEELAIDTLKIGATDYILKERLSRIVPSVRRALREREERAERKRAQALLSEEKRLLEMIARGYRLSTVLNALCEVVEKLSEGSLCCILLLTPDGNRLWHGAAPSLPKSYTDAINGASIGPAVGSCGTAAYRKEAVIVSDIARDPLWANYRDLALPHGLQACWSMPIFASEGSVLGTFATYYREPRTPTASEQNMIEQITNLASIAIERKRAEDDRQAHLSFLESMDSVNRAIQGTSDLEQMMRDVLDAVLAIFHSDRAWLVYPCDPGAPTWKVLMERTTPQFPGAFALERDLPVTPDVAEVFQTVRAFRSPVRFGPGSKHPLPAETAARFSIQSVMGMAVYPKGDKPYMFGLHQCSYPRIWTAQEERLFQEIGRRLEDALTSVFIFRNLAESERKLEEAERLTHVGYWEHDLDTDLITWSDETYRIYGMPNDARTITMGRFQELIDPENRTTVFEAVSAALRGGRRYDVEYRVIRPDDEVRIVHSQGDVTRDESGRPRRIFGTVQDITERRRAEEELFEVKEWFRLLAESSLAGIYLIQDERFRYVNPATAKMLGYRVEEIIDKLGPLDLVHPDDRELVAENVRRRIEGDTEETRYEYRILRKDRSVCNVEVHGRRIELGGKVGVLGTQLDITERRRAEDTLRKTEAELAHVARVATLGEMGASIAHEINQPLGAIANNASASLRWLAANNVEEARRSAELIRGDAHRAGEIIQRIWSFAKKAPPQKDWIDINQAIREVVALARSELQRHGVSVEMQFSDHIQPATLVFADRIQLQQVILNLIMNAVEAMSEVSDGPRELLIRTGADASAGIVVALRDSGPGLSHENLDRLFTPFYTTKPQGMGMGLAICRSIVEVHGGRLWATPNEDRGATFQFILPIGGEG